MQITLSREAKKMLASLAARDHRSMSNMLETLILDRYYLEHGGSGHRPRPPQAAGSEEPILGVVRAA